MSEEFIEFLNQQKSHWEWIIKAYPNSGASATAERAIKEIDNFILYGCI
jgi:hypothetical protein